MSHNHHHNDQPPSLANLILAILINGGIVVFEMIFGLLISSMALISDAVHNLSDIAAMSFTCWAEKMSRRPATEHKTYGWRKMEFIAAFVNSIVLSVVIAFVFWESVQRLFSPAQVSGTMMLWVAVVAFVGNSAATLLLQKISARNFNIKSAWLHSLQDALFSLGVIVGALLIMHFDLYFIDPLISMVICIFIAREIYKIIRHTVNALLDSVPADVDFNAVKRDLLSVSGVAEVNDLHIWQTGTGQKLLSAHLVSDDEAPDHEQIIRAVQKILHEDHGIDHTTIQLLPSSAREMEHCNHCN
ncbi:MAG TPA: cation diffusion facilitator family transporter [Smithellaceae bacterium]|jgi:cobalt-zinc-cadmium efflux system protein|nr:cation diffusion facilitator family transporter [Smithellaceae bacterium]